MTGRLTLDNAGSTIRRLRAEAALTQTELAERLGWDKTRVSKYENGRLQMSVAVIEEMAAAMGYRPEVVIIEILSDRYTSLKKSAAGKIVSRLLNELGKKHTQPPSS